MYAQIESRPRCLVYLLDLYLGKLPQWAKDRNVFYVWPSKNVPSNPTSPWYDCVPLGKEKLRKFVVVMCKEAGINEKKMNHSLRATGATAKFNASVPEKMIRDVTGHRSKALMLYECPSIEQQKAVTSVLMNGQENVGITPAAKPVLRERSV